MRLRLRRLLVAVLTLLALAGLLVWQWSREREMAACAARGGVWNGPQSRCEAPRGPILKRDIERG